MSNQRISDDSLRKQAQDRVTLVLERRGIRDALRGSWKHGDFHLFPDGTSLSDLDLVIRGLNETELQRLKRVLALELRDFPMNVSVHSDDALLKMNLADSRILNIGEYIAKVRRPGVAIGYLAAKILLLLLRADPTERYIATAFRLGIREALVALQVKLGQQATFTPSMASRLAAFSGEPTALEFVRECIDKRPTFEYVEEVASRVRECPTVNAWLKAYLLHKMGIGA